MIDEKKTTTGFCQRLFLNYSPNFLRNIIKSTAPIIRMADAAIITMFKMEICPEDVFCEFSEIPDVVATFSVGEKVIRQFYLCLWRLKYRCLPVLLLVTGIGNGVITV